VTLIQAAVTYGRVGPTSARRTSWRSALWYWRKPYDPNDRGQYTVVVGYNL
jgi:hypothetical protein